MANLKGQMQPSPLSKACENCRIRKIRCNRINPCSNCSTSGIECRPSKRTEHGPRMVVSSHYEKQIERIHERLVGIESVLKSFSIPGSTPTTQSHTSQSTTQSASITTPSQYEGDSSFQSQSVRATEVARSLNFKNDGGLSNAINSLKSIINAKDIPGTAARDLHFTSAGNRTVGLQMESLPADFVIKLLARVQERFTICIYKFFLLNDGRLERICQRSYFPTEPLSLGEMTTMYGMLWYIISEYMIFGDPITEEYDCAKYVNICEKNFHAGIETYNLIAEPSFDNAFALMLAASKAQDEGKVILCWSLSSAAARHLQALGYHRECALANEPPTSAEKRRYLFWTVYGIEKNLSLNLGRASSFQDWDIDVKMFQVSSDPAVRPWNLGTILSIEWSRVQGQMYEQLYSASAAKKSNSERLKSIDDLSQQLDKVYEEFRRVDRSQAVYGEFSQMLFEACDVIYYSLVTLLHRAAPNPDDGTEISSKCFEAAKMCLKSHLHYFPRFTRHGETITVRFVNYLLLYSSFTPCIVVFLHAIASSSPSDVDLLQAMTSSLEPVSTLSPVLNRLHSVCAVFSRVADRIVRRQNEALNPSSETTSNAGGGSVVGLGSYDEETDRLFFPGFTGHHAFDAGRPLPGIFTQGSGNGDLGSVDGGGGDDRVDGAQDPVDMDYMSAYFGNWLSSHQPAMDLFSIDFGGNA